MATLLQIATAVADETKGPRFANVAQNVDPDAQNILRLVNKVGTRLMRIYDWNILRAEETVSATGDEILIPSASMPVDFDRFVPETFWDRSTNNLLSGPVSPVEWNGLKVQTFSSQNKKFIFRGGSVLTQPIFDSGTDLAFEYISNFWCENSLGAGLVSMTSDTDVSRLDSELMISIVKYEWLASEGQPTPAAVAEAKEMIARLINNDASSENIAVTADIFAQNTRHFEGAPKASRASYGGDF
ncbi:MAG: hypothetical protein V3U88_08620 [Methylococcales bacterium]